MRHRFRSLLIVLFALGGPRATAAADKPSFPEDRPLDMVHIRLDLRVDLKAKTVKATATVDLAALREVNQIQLNAVGLDVSRLNLQPEGGSPAPCPYEIDDQHLTILPPKPLEADGKIQAQIEYQVTDPEAGLYFFGPTPEVPDAPYILWSQGESITNRYWIPCFDHPNEMQTSEIVCTVDAPNIAVSNGRLVTKTDNPDGTRTFHWLQDQPHVAYLVTLVVGEFVSKTETWRGKPVTYYVRERFADQIENSFSNTLAMLDLFSDKIGVEYPWDKYDQVCCYEFGGGMENTSSTTLTESTLHDDRAHLDDNSDGLVAHELAHQWWGDLVTCKDWAHIWLNEGFATYFEALWTEHNLGPDEFAVNMHRKARRAIDGGKDKPIVYRDYDSPDQQFDDRAYPKGAWVLHMIRRTLGDETFWRVMKTYCTRYRHRTVETSDFRQVIEEVTGRAFGRFFHDWTERPGSPDVLVSYEWQAGDRLASVEVEQEQQADAFTFPLTLEFAFDESRPPFTLTKDIGSKEEHFFIPLPARPRMLRVDPLNAVLMQLTEKKPRAMWRAQLERDSNPVGRIRAAEHFGEDGGSANAAFLAERLRQEPFWAVQAAIAKALGSLDCDAARDALIRNLSATHPKTRTAVAEALGSFEDDAKAEAALLRIVTDGDASYRVEAAAIKAYAETCVEDPMPVLEGLMDRQSDGEIIRSAVLEAIGRHGDAESLDLLIEWTRPDKESRARSAAVRAIAAIHGRSAIDPTEAGEAVDAIAACLKKGNRRLQSTALEALGEMGQAAKPSLPTLERLVKVGQPRIRAKAAQILEKIRGASPQVEELVRIRSRLEAIEAENRDLLDRLQKLEAREPASATPQQSSR